MSLVKGSETDGHHRYYSVRDDCKHKQRTSNFVIERVLSSPSKRSDVQVLSLVPAQRVAVIKMYQIIYLLVYDSIIKM